MRWASAISVGLILLVSPGCGAARRQAAREAARDSAPAAAQAPAKSNEAKLAELKARAADKYAAGNIDGALADYQQGIRLDPKAGWAHLNAGIIRIQKGDTAGGLKMMDEAVRLSPERADFRRERGLARHRAAKSPEDLKAALADMDAAVTLDADLPLVYAQRAAVYKDFGDEEGVRWAVADLKTALEKSRGPEEAGQIRRMLGELEALKTAAAAPAAK